MKVCIVQPKYSTNHAESDLYFEEMLSYFDACDESMDIIVFPEDCDIPCLAKTKAEEGVSVAKYNEPLLKKASETAKRCHAMLFVNARWKGETGYRNTTYAFNREGEEVGRYYKEHLVPNESKIMELEDDYTFRHTEPTVIEMEGIRFGFLTCYDFYFYENFSHLAQKNLDVIIGCSHQRSDTHQALEIITQFLAYNTNTYVLRSSVSMDENSTIGGCSMVVGPDGTILSNMKSRVGMETVEIDVAKKYYKPAGYGNPPAAHWQYIEQGRRPYKYRFAGSSVVQPDDMMPYPRVCAHRGFNTIAPENSMPAFGAAVAMGAEEIEFDLWCSKDGEVVSMHDPSFERVSDTEVTLPYVPEGEKIRIFNIQYEDALKFDFGAKRAPEFTGMRVIKFEDILKKFAGQCIMNVHVKTWTDESEYDIEEMRKIVALIDKYDCRRYVYFMSGNENVIKAAKEVAPDICRCMGAGTDPWKIVDKAIELDCQKVQLFKPYFNQEMIDKAHKNGIICNVFWSDKPEEAVEFINMGIDTILTNDYNRIALAIKNR